jgi:hypothetical protein
VRFRATKSPPESGPIGLDERRSDSEPERYEPGTAPGDPGAPDYEPRPGNADAPSAGSASEAAASGAHVEDELTSTDTPAPEANTATAAAPEQPAPAPNMLPGRERRRFGAERLLMRLIATAGIVGIGVGIAAILAASNVQGWIIGLVVALLSVALSAILWSSRQL